MGVFDFLRKSIPMRGNVRAIEQDAAGNILYLSNAFCSRNISTYNMADLTDKGRAVSVCTPLSTVLDKLGMMIQRGQLYVMDEEGNEEKFQAFKDALLSPNPLQTFSAFIRDVEVCLRLYGFCPISVMRGISTLPFKSMWVIDPTIFHLKGTGKIYKQFEIDEIVKEASYQWNGQRIVLQPDEYFIIHNGQISYNQASGDITFSSYTDSLSIPVNNWMAAMSATHTLVQNGGPKGVLYNDYQDAMGNNPMTESEKMEIHKQFNEKYGIVKGKSPIFISPKKLGWLPMDYNAEQLKLGDIDDRCTAKICNAFGLNANLFTDAKYDNQESAKKAAYQDVIIPDAKVISEAITRAVLPEGAHMEIDFSDVECLQKNKKDEAQTLQTAAAAINALLNNGLVSFDEARKEIANYIDIDPDELKRVEGEEVQDEQVQE